ncbi:MAG: hypothetical protein QXU32_01410 [Nitrososphaerales archaeon]
MLVEIEAVLMVVIAYIIGLLSVTFFNRHRSGSSFVLSEYESKLREYESMLVDLKVRLDTMELRTAKVSSQVSQGVGDVSDDNHSRTVIRRDLEQQGKGMVDYVLKLLVDGPKTSRQIEVVIGRSREHTARLMKKMFELGYVTRDITKKPYTYAITESGKNVLSQVASVKTSV